MVLQNYLISWNLVEDFYQIDGSATPQIIQSLSTAPQLPLGWFRFEKSSLRPSLRETEVHSQLQMKSKKYVKLKV